MLYTIKDIKAAVIEKARKDCEQCEGKGWYVSQEYQCAPLCNKCLPPEFIFDVLNYIGSRLQPEKKVERWRKV